MTSQSRQKLACSMFEILAYAPANESKRIFQFQERRDQSLCAHCPHTTITSEQAARSRFKRCASRAGFFTRFCAPRNCESGNNSVVLTRCFRAVRSRPPTRCNRRFSYAEQHESFCHFSDGVRDRRLHNFVRPPCVSVASNRRESKADCRL